MHPGRNDPGPGPAEKGVVLEDSAQEYSALITPPGDGLDASDRPLPIQLDAAILNIAVESLQRAGVDEVLVAAGSGREELEGWLADRGARTVYHPDFKRGPLGSIRAGAGLISPGRGFFVLPVSAGLVRPWTHQILMEEFERTGPDVVYPVFQNQRGYPLLISARLIPEITAAADDFFLKILEGPGALAVEAPDRHILPDLDAFQGQGRLAELAARRDIPTAEECAVIHRRLGPLCPEIVRHCRTVARVAEDIARALAETGTTLDLGLIRAAALLHDIAKDARNHAEVGAQWLRERGFPRVADIVACHTDLAVSEEDVISEAVIVYLADKMAPGDRVESIGYRYQEAVRRYGRNPAALQRIEQRRARAELCQRRVEEKLRAPLARFIRPPRKADPGDRRPADKL